MNSDSRLDPVRRLDMALSTAAEVNRVIAAADAKAGLALAAQGVVLAGVTSVRRTVESVPDAARVCCLLALAFCCISVFCLLGVLWPRTRGTTRTWFAYPSLYGGTASHTAIDPVDVGAGVWAQTETLAAIARQKFLWLRPALTAGAAGLFAAATAAALTSY